MKKFYPISRTSLIFIFWANALLLLAAPLHGTYTIGTSGVTDFSTITDALTALNDGVAGPVVFNIQAGTYAENLSFSDIPGASSVNNIIFQGDGSGTVNIKGSDNQTLRFTNAHYYQFKDLTFSSSYQFAYLADIVSNSSDIAFLDCQFLNNLNGTGIYNEYSQTDHFIVQNCSFHDGDYGILYYGNAGSPTLGMSISGSTFTNQLYDGIYCDNNIGSASLHENIINSNTTYDYYNAIFFGDCYNITDISITKNKINVSNGYAMYLTGLQADVSNPILVANNFAVSSGFGNSGCVYTSYLNNANFYYNTFVDRHNNTDNYALRFFYGTGNNVSNNILIQEGLQTAPLQLYYTNTILDYNDYKSSSPYLVWQNYSLYYDLPTWNAASGQDAHSVSIDPAFYSSSDLHVSNSLLNGLGTPLASVTDDIDGDARDAVAPDMGGDEFTPAPLDAAITGIPSPAMPLAPGSQMVSITLYNNGLDPITSADINWDINGTPQTPVAWTGTLAPGGSINVDLGTGTFSDGVSYLIHAVVTNPNGGSDPNTFNDSFTSTELFTSLCGTYTIGGVDPNFPDFSTAALALNGSGITCPVVFDVRSGNYTEQVTLKEILGTSDVNTVTFQSESGSAGDVTLEWAASYPTYHTLKMEGSDYVSFLNMTINGNDPNYNYVVELTNNPSHITFDGCLINVNSSSNSGGIWSDEGALNYLTVQNCVINGGSRGIYLYGGYGAIENLVVENSNFIQQTEFGIYLNYQIIAPQIRNNLIWTYFTNTYYYGLYSYYIQGAAEITGNKIYGSGYGIYMYNNQGSPLEKCLVANNFIMQSVNAQSGIVLDYCSNTNVFNNSVRSALSGYALSMYYTGSDCSAVNNIFDSEGSSACLIQYSSSVLMDHNAYFKTGPVFAYNNGAIVSDLAAWQTVSGQDVNSIFANPFFVSPTDLHTTQVLFNGTAVPVGITTDIDGETRSATPDIGADEFDPPAVDAALIGFASPVMPFSPGTNDITVILQNQGASDITSADIEWFVNGASGGTFNWTGLLTTGQSANVVVGNYAFSAGTTYQVEAIVSNPNMTSDGNPANDYISSSNLYTALCGTYTIGGVSPDFASFTDAVNALNTGGVNCPVVFNVRSGVYFEQVVLNQVPGSSAVNTITFQAESGNAADVELTFDGPDYEHNYTFGFNGSDYVTLHNLTITGTNYYYCHPISFLGNASHISIDHCIVNALGGYIYYADVVGVYANDASNPDHLTISNCTLNGGGYGVYFYSNYNNKPPGIQILNNTFQNQYNNGLYFYACDGLRLSGNQIDGSGYSNYNYYGMYISQCYGTNEISKNKITSPGGGINIYYQYNYPNRTLIANNFIHCQQQYGIYAYQSSYMDIVFNNINQSSSNADLYLLYCSDINVKNNILANTGGGYCPFYLYSGVNSNNNDFFTTGAYIGFFNYNTFPNLTDWQSYTGQDLNSKSIDPFFFSADDLHVNQSFLNASGMTFAGITDDIDGDTRAIIPDIGADEFASAPDDAGIAALVAPISPFSVGTQSVSVQLVNYGSSDLTAVEIYMEDNGVVQPVYTWTGTITSGNGINVEINPAFLFDLQYHNLRFWTSNPNGNVDGFQPNDTFSITIHPSLCGIYTIGGVSPDFANFSEAANALNAFGVSCAVTFNVRAGTYDEQISFGEIFGSSPVNTVRFTSESGNAADVILTHNSDYPNFHTVRFDGSDNIRFDHLTVEGTNYYYCHPFEINGDADHITISDCTINPNGGYYYYTYVTGIFGSFLNNSDHLTITGNQINHGGYGIYLSNYSGSPATNVLVDNNQLIGQELYGINLEYNFDDPVISNNVLSGSTYYYFNNIYIYSNIYRAKVTGNKILGNTGYGIRLQNCYGSIANHCLVANNFVSLNSSYSDAMGLFEQDCNNTDFVYNSVNMFGPDPSIAAAGIYYGTDINFINNILDASAGGRALRFYGSPSGFTMDYNDLFTTGPVLVDNAGSWLSNLAGWQGASGQDAHSVSVTPNFVSSTDLHASHIALNGAAISLAYVTNDIDGEMRTPTPDIGADEFTPLADDAGISAMNSPALPFSVGTQPINVQLFNFGSAEITSADIYVEIDGVVQPVYNWTGTLASGTGTSVEINPGYAFALQSYNLRFWSSLPNGNPDGYNGNDTFSISIHPSLCGVYTIGGASPDFATLTDATDALNEFGVSCPVTFNMRPGTYNEQVVIGSIYGSSNVNTVTFTSETGNASDVVITYNADYPNYFYTIKLSSTDNIFFNHLTVRGTNYYYCHPFDLENDLVNVGISDCIIEPNGGYYYSDYLTGINANLNGSDHVMITGNTINGGNNGVVIIGNSGAPPTNILIENNTMNGQNQYGIRLDYYLNAPKVKNNLITTYTSGASYGCGIFLYNQINNGSEVTGNKIVRNEGHGILIQACYGTGANHILVANNFVSLGSLSPDVAGIYDYYSDYVDYFYNSVLIAGSNPTTAAMRFEGGNFIRSINNALANTGGGLSMRFPNQPLNFVSDYNDLFTSGATLVDNGGTTYSDLAAWQGTGFDTHSVSANPQYVNFDDLHASQIMINGAAQTQPSVPNDIDGETRSVTPDIGADEFTPLDNDLTIVGFVTPISGCGSTATEPVTIIIQNNGSVPQTGFDVSYTFNSGATFTENVGALTVNPGMTANYTFGSTVDMSVPGNYPLSGTVALASDVNPGNDEFLTIVSAYDPVDGSLTPGATICAGQDVYLYAGGGSSFLWSTGSTGSNIYVNPIMTSTYTVTITNNFGCTQVLSSTLTVDPAPGDTTVWGPDQWNVYCYNGSLSNGLPFYGYTGFYTRTDPSFVTSSDWNIYSAPSTAATYSGCSMNTDFFSFKAKREGFTPGNYDIILHDWDDNIEVVLNGVSIYSAGCCNSGQNVFIYSGPLDASSQVELRFHEGGGGAFVNLEFRVCEPSTMPDGISGNTTIYDCESTTLTAIGGIAGSGSEVVWYEGSCGGTPVGTGNSITVSPDVTTTYYARRESTCGNTECASITVNVTGGAPGDPSVFGTDQWNVYAYEGNNFDAYYGYYTDPNTSFNSTNYWGIYGAPSDASTYVGCAVGADNHSYSAKRQGFACGQYQVVAQNWDDNIDILVNGVTVAGYGCCSGGSNIVVWTGTLDASSQIEVRMKEGGGSSYSYVEIRSLPMGGTVSLTGVSSICPGQDPGIIYDITSSPGAEPVSYQWESSPDNMSWSEIPGEMGNSYDPLTLSATTYFRRRATDNCLNVGYSNIIQIDVAPLSATITPSGPTTFCDGGSVVLTASGGDSYAWSTTETTPGITVNTSGVYTVTVTNTTSGCTSTGEVTVLVKPNPTAGITGSSEVCYGTQATLDASGGISYHWSTGENTSTIHPYVYSATTYIVTVTSDNGCSDTESHVVNVSPAPSAGITGDLEICAGESTTLTASGGASDSDYHWNIGEDLTAITVSPAFSTAYHVTVTGSNGCTAVADATVQVNHTFANISGNAYYCVGGSTTLTASGGDQYNWSNGESSAEITVTDAETFTVTVTNSATGCTGTATINVQEIANPVASINPASPSVCGGSPLTLTASGGTSYLWSTTETSSAITVTPSMSTSYAVTVSNSYGCSSATSVSVSVGNNAPVLSFEGTGNYVSHVVDPLSASTYDPFHFLVRYTDADGDLPLSSYPRVLLDYEGDGSYFGANDRLFIMHEVDPLDVDVTDGKLYYYDASGLPVGTNYKTTIQATDVNNCSTNFGPFNEPDVLDDADIFIFANDIQFSDPHPDPSQVITVSATIHNESDFEANNFVVHMVNQNTGEIYTDILVPSLPAHATTTVSWTITTPPVPSWNPLQVFIDYTNVINEPNELDNQAIRPFINGDFNVPGDIEVTASVSPQTSYANPGNFLSICGSAKYVNTAVPLMDPSVAGATVTITLLETGATYSTYTNSYGHYCYGFYAPVTPGLYHMTVEVTDYTLTGDTTAQFVLIPPPCQTDLSCELSVSSNSILQGESITGSLLVRNVGCQDVLVPSLVTVELPAGTPVPGPFVVPPLASGATYTINLPSMTFPNVGTTYLRTNIDATNVVVESNESNNSCLQYISVCAPVPDIYAGANVLYGPYYQCVPYNYNFFIYNIGCVPTGPFSAQVTVFNHATGSTTTFPFTVSGIGASSYTLVNVPFNYPNTGDYTFTLSADIGNIVTELSETNNVWTQTVSVYSCIANLSVSDCQLHVDPLDPSGTMTVSALVTNNGNAAVASSFDVNFEVQGVIYTATVAAGLGSGQNTNVVVNSVPVPPIPGFIMTVTADPSNAIIEVSEFDNVAHGSLCYDFQPVRLCYTAMFWDYPRVVNQPVVFYIGMHNNGLYNASTGVVNFKVSGPGLSGTIDLGNATISPAYSTVCGCPMQLTLPTPFAFPEIGTYHVVMTADPGHIYDECDESNNVMEVNVIVTNLPDYRILSQHIAPSKLNPDVGEPIIIDVTYENIGNDGTADSLNIKVLVDEIALDSVRDRGLAPGDHWTVEMPHTWSSTIPGTHIIRAIADSKYEINEGNETNNEATRAVIVGQAPNLFFNSFDASEPSGGQEFQYSTFTSDIGNEGDLSCDAFVQYFYINDSGDTTYIGQQPITVPANNHIVITYSWLVFDNSTKIIAKIVNSTPEESRYDDNTASDIIGSFTVEFTRMPETCIGYANGTATAIVSGGQEPYQFVWSNGASGASITDGAGMYTVDITDALGNTGTYGVMIDVLPDNTDPLIYNVPSSITHFANDGVCPALITWEEPLATDNCGVSSFTSNYSPGDGFSNGTTVVIYTATDAAGNTSSATFNVTVVGAPLVYAGADVTVCSTESSLNAADPGVGSGAWTTLSGTGIVTDPGNSVSQVTNLSPGANVFIWSVVNGTCGSGTDTVVIFNDNVTYYQDADHDEFGNPLVTVTGCGGPPEGYVSNALDCDDTNHFIHPGASEVCDGIDNNCNGIADEGLPTNTYYADADMDGYGSLATTTVSCMETPPEGYVSTIGDCNDADNHVNPGVSETCNGLDDNCDGNIDEGVLTTFYQDVDGDGYGNNASATQACSAPDGYSSLGGDCDDMNNAVNPGETETCNGVDDNCNGETDEGLLTTYYADTDSDGFGDPSSSVDACTQPMDYVTNNNDCNDDNGAVNPDATEVCNLIDDNCNGSIDESGTFIFYQDADNDGFGVADVTVSGCTPPTGYTSESGDCNDADAFIHPGVVDGCDGVDNDCDGLYDEDNPCFIPEACTIALPVTVGATADAAPITVVHSGSDEGVPAGSCASGSDGATRDVWYSFTAPSTGRSLILTTSLAPGYGAYDDWVMEVYSDCPTFGGTEVVCNDNSANGNLPRIELCQSQYVAGQTYYIRLYPREASAPSSAFVLLQVYQSFPCAAPPSNDDCGGSTLVVSHPYTSGDCQFRVLNTNNATQSAGNPECSASVVNRDVWIRFVGRAPTHYLRYYNVNPIQGTPTQVGMALYTSCNSAPIACYAFGDGSMGEQVIHGITLNQVYYLRIWTIGSNPGNNTTAEMNICLMHDAAVLNDACEDASSIALCPAVTSGSNIGSTPNWIGVPQPDCFNWPVVADVWYTFNSGTMQNVVINISNTTNRIYSAVYKGDCSSMNLVPGSCGNGSRSIQLNGLEQNTNYFVRVWSRPLQQTTFDICLEGITYYADSDGDGYGNPAAPTTSFNDPPSGYVANNLDCNDSNNAIHPGVVDVCDGIDNDCDGRIDEDVTTCGITTGLSESGITMNSASLSWSSTPCALRYRILYRIFGAGAWNSIDVYTPATNYLLTGLVPGTRYQWRIRTICSGTNSDLSVIREFTTPLTLMGGNTQGILTLENSFDVFPNPGDGYFNVRLYSGEEQKGELTVTDNLGRIVRTESLSLLKGLQTQTLDISGYPDGVYFVKVQLKDELVTRRVIKH